MREVGPGITRCEPMRARLVAPPAVILKERPPLTALEPALSVQRIVKALYAFSAFGRPVTL